jgi:hypothetical protein
MEDDIDETIDDHHEFVGGWTYQYLQDVHLRVIFVTFQLLNLTNLNKWIICH